MSPKTTIFDLSLDIKYIIIEYLDNRSLAYLAQTCAYFGNLIRKLFSFRKAQVTLVDHLLPKLPPFLNYRAGTSIGSMFYLPFINESPFCYCYDLDNHIWSTHKLNLVDMHDFQPQITCSATIGCKIYLACGRLLNSYTLSNAMIEIDTTNFNTRFVKDAEGNPPRPRHEHSVDAIMDRYLVVFGGLCYNSVGENDVFVYDIFENRWFVPPVSGHLPHLRFGHASAVIGSDLYIHGGAQLENDSSYTVYDDLYKLDCKNWVWYKYEHPEVEQYLRNQIPTPGESPQRNHLISTNGDSPYDRFQSYMCSFGNKLVVFGGHSIREDEDDNEILCSYPLNELCVFNTKRKTWTILHASVFKNDVLAEDDEDQPITVSDMSVAPIPLDSYGVRIYIIAGHKAAEVPRTVTQYESMDRVSHTSSKRSSTSMSELSQHHSTLPSITEHTSQHQIDVEENTNGPSIDQNDGLDYEEESDHHRPGLPNHQIETRTPSGDEISNHVKELFRAVDPDMEDNHEARDRQQETEITERANNKVHMRSSRSSSGSSNDIGRKKRRRPSISVIHRNTHSTEDDLHMSMPRSSSSHSSYSSNSSSSFGQRRTTRQRKVTPCSVILELIE
ncbi:uncharacterized protein B0P05DRAFT_498105 [Gilbertella persicaria]|uniref:uncharacterized protein n=1 Tax=Gilbertella persicaria TaxID=101096 RepID=UPI00221F66D3|nr:uncharacterized protein B0P05DRAFT_498105 [Gilbertella persicaria]KAI8059422.1 hypothetical protein B0P05DRAFT_498105 [Gilbertella persicaria]